ncbi:MAG: ABC transporter permease [Treponema sp.]|nr:ABC transporter permease [Treponema sp.]
MISTTLMIVAPILIAAIGGMICERSGVVNIALEGLMAIGAMTAAITHILLETGTVFSIPLALIFASLAGGALSLLHAFASITLKADQVISGTGINLLSNGMTIFICQILFRMDRTPSYRMGMRSGLLGIYPTIWIALIILLAAWFFIYKRPWGLRLRAAGENPQAAVSAGVNVIKLRYTAIIISGLLAGLAGACLVLTQDIQFTANAINGKGFIALAAVSFGRWIPLGVLGSSFLFGLSSSLAVNIININLLSFLPSEMFNMLPFLITLITLVVFSRNSQAPRALGVSLD